MLANVNKFTNYSKNIKQGMVARAVAIANALRKTCILQNTINAKP